MVPRTVLLAMALALAAIGAAPGRAAERSPVFGVNVNRVINDDFRPAHWNRPFADVRASGLTEARTDAFWMWAEPRPPRHGRHTYEWWRLDAVATALARHHLRWLAVLDY